MTIRVLVVTDIRLYRDGLAQILGREPQLSIVGAAADIEQARALLRDLRPDVLLIDLAMPSGLDSIPMLRSFAPEVNVVALAAPVTDEEVVAYAEAGVAGYVPREAGVSELVVTVQSVGRGELLCSPRVAAALLKRVTMLSTSRDPAADGSHLTAREREVLRFVERGLSNKDIALELGIEVATVKNHVHRILEKLRVHRRGQAAVRWREAPRVTRGIDQKI